MGTAQNIFSLAVLTTVIVPKLLAQEDDYPCRTNSFCSEYYCCYNYNCRIGTYKELINPLGDNVYMSVPKRPLSRYIVRKKIKCGLNAAPKGKQLNEHEPGKFGGYSNATIRLFRGDSQRCRSDDDCNDYYCCVGGQCRIGTHEALIDQVGADVYLIVVKDAHSKKRDKNSRKRVNCRNFDVGKGRPLVEVDSANDECKAEENKSENVNLEENDMGSSKGEPQQLQKPGGMDSQKCWSDLDCNEYGCCVDYVCVPGIYKQTVNEQSYTTMLSQRGYYSYYSPNYPTVGKKVSCERMADKEGRPLDDNKPDYRNDDKAVTEKRNQQKPDKCDSDDECNEYYCCVDKKCHIGTYEVLIEKRDMDDLVVVKKDPYRAETDEIRKKMVNCTNFVLGEGSPLFELDEEFIDYVQNNEKPKELSPNGGIRKEQPQQSESPEKKVTKEYGFASNIEATQGLQLPVVEYDMGCYSDYDCSEYYCCINMECIVGTYELLKEPNLTNLVVSKKAYADPLYDYYDKPIDCSMYSRGSGTPLTTKLND